MNYITFSYDSTRSKGIGFICIGSALVAAFAYNSYWLAVLLFVLGIAVDTRIKKDKQP